MNIEESFTVARKGQLTLLVWHRVRAARERILRRYFGPTEGVICMPQVCRAILILVSFLVGPVALSSAQQMHALPPKAGPITVVDIVQMSHAGLSDDVIIQQISKKHAHFDLTPQQLMDLRVASVSNPVIQAMEGMTEPAAVQPTELGVYVKKDGKWKEIEPEVVNIKTGGVVKSSFSLGVVKGDINGIVNGARSRNSVTTPCDFVIVLPEGTAITEYQLVRLHQHDESREFRSVTGGVFHASTGETRDNLTFAGTKIAPHTYTISFDSNTGSGEYGFLPPGSYTSANVSSSGKLYSFRIYE
jgi:hypothetical protein